MLRLTDSAGADIFISPAVITVIDTTADGTRILLDNGTQVTVKESPAEVLAAIDAERKDALIAYFRGDPLKFVEPQGENFTRPNTSPTRT